MMWVEDDGSVPGLGRATISAGDPILWPGQREAIMMLIVDHMLAGEAHDGYMRRSYELELTVESLDLLRLSRRKLRIKHR